MEQCATLNEFDKKIEVLRHHPKFESIKKQAEDAKRAWYSYGWPMIAATEFVERIAAMPLDYIFGWLDGKNELTWRAEDRNMLDAIKSGCVHILERHPGSMIRRIGNGAEKFYLECGWEVAERNENDLIVYKEGEQT